jgi:hypothetical protein
MNPDKAPKPPELKLEVSKSSLERLFQFGSEFLKMFREGDDAHADQYDRRQFVTPTTDEMNQIIETFENYTFQYTPGSYKSHQIEVGSLIISPHILPFADEDGTYHMRVTAKRIPLESAIRLDLSAFPFVILDEDDHMIRPSCEPGNTLYFYGFRKDSWYRFVKIEE